MKEAQEQMAHKPARCLYTPSHKLLWDHSASKAGSQMIKKTTCKVWPIAPGLVNNFPRRKNVTDKSFIKFKIPKSIE